MTYNQVIEYLYTRVPMFERQGKDGYKEGLFNTLALDKHLEHPHRNYPTIHIAGTNGKGTCAHTLAAFFQCLGKKTGLYTSPHIIDFCERIKVNGITIKQQYVTDFIQRERSFFEPLYPSFFEITTALAFKYFSDMKVDIAIIETGLGGRLDCTNIVNPALSIITNISLDHMQMLGNTIEKIAYEKAGIMKRNVAVLIGEANERTHNVFDRQSDFIGAPITYAQDDPEILSVTKNPDGSLTFFTRSYNEIQGELGGPYQINNANTILKAINMLVDTPLLQQKTTKKTVENAVKKSFANVVNLTGINARWQKIATKPDIICDAGHNIGAWKQLGPRLKDIQCGKLHIIIGLSEDKNVDAILDEIPKHAILYFTQADSQRAMKAKELKGKAKKHGLQGQSYENVKEAFDAAKSMSQENDVIFVGGSFYVIGDLFQCIR